MNQVVLTGRVDYLSEMMSLKYGKGKFRILAVQIPNGMFDPVEEGERGYIDCLLKNDEAFNITNYVKSGDMVGVKGSLQLDCGRLIVNTEKVVVLTKSKENQEVKKLEEELEKKHEQEEDYEM